MTGSPLEHSRKLSTILFIDIVGYTLSMHRDEKKALSMIETFKKVLDIEFKNKGGIFKQYQGDGCLCVFDSSNRAIEFSIKIQSQYVLEKVPVRIGVHLGEVVFKDDTVFGDGVNIASRIESFCTPGSILISEQVRNLIKNNSSIKSRSMGSFLFKNIESPIHLYAISNDGIIIPNPKKLTGKGIKSNQINSTIAKHFLVGISLILLLLVVDHFFINVISSKNGIVLFKEDVEVSEASIAVLPLFNLSGNKEYEYFESSLAQEIIDELAQVSSIRVSAFSQSVFYKNRDDSPLDIAKELNVNYIISGSFRYLNETDQIKLSIDLFNPHNNESIWSGVFLKRLNELHTIQSELALKVTGKLNLDLNEIESQSINKLNTTSGEAFKLLLLAKSEIDNLTPESLFKAENYLLKAIELDSNYQQAYTLLAWTMILTTDPSLVPGTISSDEAISNITPLIERALVLDPNSSDTYLVRASFNLYNKNKVADAVRDVEKAIKLKSWPTVPTNFCTCIITTTYVASKNSIEARGSMRLSQEVDPNNVLLSWDKGNVHMIDGQYDIASEFYLQAVDQIDNAYFNTFLGWSYFHDKDFGEAVKVLKYAYNIDELPLAMTTAYLSITYYALGDLKESNYYLSELINRQSAGENHLNLYLAMIYASRNDTQRALQSLEKAFDKNENGLAIMTSLDPVFQTIASENRFLALRKKMQFENP